MSEITGQKHEGRWKRGQSGNPTGRPKGARNRTTLAAQALLEGEAEALARTCIDRALAGDPVALRLCLDRILAPRKDRPVDLPLHPITNTADLTKAMAALLEAVVSGRLTPVEGQGVAALFESYRRTLESTEVKPPAPPIQVEHRHKLNLSMLSDEELLAFRNAVAKARGLPAREMQPRTVDVTPTDVLAVRALSRTKAPH